MAEKKNAISYESVMKDLKARKFAPGYVLMGDFDHFNLAGCGVVPRRCRWWISVRDIR